MIPKALFSGLPINRFIVAPKAKPSFQEANFSKEKTYKNSFLVSQKSPKIVQKSEKGPGGQ